MKYTDMKRGVRVIVTHHSSKDKGKTGVILGTSRPLGRYYADVKLDDGTEREFYHASINLAPDVKPAPKEPESAPKPLTADDIVVGTELIYKGGLALSGRRVGDVYVVYEIDKHGHYSGNDGIWYKYKSGAKPNPSWEDGKLYRGDILKYWEIAL